MTAGNYKLLEKLPVSDWVNQVTEGDLVYRKPTGRKQMKVFNVIVSVLNKGCPLFPFSSRILGLTDRTGFDVFTSLIYLVIAFYFAEKKSGTVIARQKTKLLDAKVSIFSVTSTKVRQVTGDESIHDFEDDLEYYSAMDSGCEIIITEDLDGFYYPKIPVMDCGALINTFF